MLRLPRLLNVPLPTLLLMAVLELPPASLTVRLPPVLTLVNVLLLAPLPLVMDMFPKTDKENVVDPVGSTVMVLFPAPLLTVRLPTTVIAAWDWLPNVRVSLPTLKLTTMFLTLLL